MVKISNYVLRERKDGTTFVSLELTGGLEILQSQTTGNFYATVKRCNIPSTFDENVAKMMVGQEIAGDVVRVQVEPYEYTNKRTGEVMILNHSYAYRPAGSLELMGETRVEKIEVPFQ